MAIAVAAKVCSKCGIEKSHDRFSKHESTRDGLRSYCKECARGQLREWRRTSPAHVAYLVAKRDDLRRYNADYYTRHRAEIKAAAKRWAEENPERARLGRRTYYESRRAEIKQKQKVYYEQNKQAFLDRAATRRARKRAAVVERVFRSVVFRRDQGLCGICRTAVDPGHWHLDHVVPLSRGGEHSYANVQVTHPECNLRKGSRAPEEVI